MSAIEQKSKIQEKVLTKSEGHDSIFLSFPTGTGKTLASLKIAQKHSALPWLILCKERNHILEWEKEIKKHKIKIKSTIICYQSLHKIKGKYNVICDEAHALTVKRRNQIIKNIQYKKILFLTATMPDTKVGHMKALSKKLKTEVRTFSITLSQAIEHGILPAPQVNVYLYQMTAAEKKKYAIIDAQIKGASWDYERYKTQKIYEKLMFLSNKRKDIVANFKTKYVRKLAKQLDNKKTRYICFTNSIKQLEWLCTSNSYIHSKRTGKTTNEDVITKFNSKKTSHIYTVKMLTESANLVDIEEGILVQLDKGKLTAIQRIGRVIRAFLPIVHIFVIQGTMDEKYLQNALEDLDNKFINYVQK